MGLLHAYDRCFHFRYDAVFLSIHRRSLYSLETKVVLVYDSYDRGYISWLPILESSISITYDQRI